jgi:hypothetical protein
MLFNLQTVFLLALALLATTVQCTSPPPTDVKFELMMGEVEGVLDKYQTYPLQQNIGKFRKVAMIRVIQNIVGKKGTKDAEFKVAQVKLLVDEESVGNNEKGKIARVQSVFRTKDINPEGKLRIIRKIVFKQLPKRESRSADGVPESFEAVAEST